MVKTRHQNRCYHKIPFATGKNLQLHSNKMKSLPYILLKSKISKSFALFRIKENLIEYTGNGLILCAFGRSY